MNIIIEVQILMQHNLATKIFQFIVLVSLFDTIFHSKLINCAIRLLKVLFLTIENKFFPTKI